MRLASSWLRLAVFMGLLATQAGCNLDSTDPQFNCGDSPPDVRADGTWKGQLGGRELSVKMQLSCVLIFVYPTWAVGGTWTWTGASTGTVDLTNQLSLKANVNQFDFRGLIITLNETPPYASVITGVANGELPLTGSQTGAWQSFSDVPVTLTRQ